MDTSYNGISSKRFRSDGRKNYGYIYFKRFEDMNFMKRSKDIEYIEINRHIMKKLTNEEIQWIVEYCDEKLEEYYG